MRATKQTELLALIQYLQALKVKDVLVLIFSPFLFFLILFLQFEIISHDIVPFLSDVSFSCSKVLGFIVFFCFCLLLFQLFLMGDQPELRTISLFIFRQFLIPADMWKIFPKKVWMSAQDVRPVLFSIISTFPHCATPDYHKTKSSQDASCAANKPGLWRQWLQKRMSVSQCLSLWIDIAEVSLHGAVETWRCGCTSFLSD